MSAASAGTGAPQSAVGAWSRQLPPPLRAFLATESGSAAVLLAATVLALVLANSPLSAAYESLWSTELAVELGDAELRYDLRHWVNDGLMVFFFFVIGLEVRRELSIGELTERGRVALPLIAAAAGLVVPAAAYLAFNPTGPGAAAFGAAVATDTAFMLGALALLGPACPTRLRVFLLTITVFDDLGAITIVALFYTETLDVVALASAAALLGLILLLRRLRVWRAPAYLVVGIALWVATIESGLHPTLVGIVAGLITTAHLPSREGVERAATAARSFRQAPTPGTARSAKLSVEAAISPNERLQELLHPWTSYLVVPIFAFANAGVALDGETLGRALGSPITLGIVLGLVAGKLVGISGASLAVARSGLGRLPRGVGPTQVAAGAAIAGIGFTVSLFIVDLALAGTPDLAEEAKIGILASGLIAALLGFLLFRLAGRRGEASEPPRALDRAVDPGRDHVRGPPDARLTLVEYGDFECPFCGQATGVVEALRERFGDELRYVFRHLPLTDVHPHAELAAEAAEAAAAQGRFWEMHDRLFAHQDELEAENLVPHALAAGLDAERFTAELAGRDHEPRVRADAESAEASGVSGTPTFFVNGLRHSGPWDVEALAARLRAGADAVTNDQGQARG